MNFYPFHFFTVKTLFFRDFTICFTNSPWIHNLLREITVNSLSLSRIYYEFTICFVISPLIHRFSPNHYEFTICFAISLWIHYLLRESTTGFANSPLIHYLFRRITMNFLSFSLFHRKNTIFFRDFTIYFTKFLWIHNLLRKFTMNSHLLWAFAINLSSFSLFHFEFTIFFADSPWIHYLFAKPLWIRYELTINSL